jgi:hypothetical protein
MRPLDPPRTAPQPGDDDSTSAAPDARTTWVRKARRVMARTTSPSNRCCALIAGRRPCPARRTDAC